MALIACPECKSTVSDQATNCPHCGYPIASPSKAPPLAETKYVSPLAETRAMIERASPSRSTSTVVKSAKSRGIYIILGLFFGCLGIHNFYAGYHGRGLAQLLIVLVLGWLIIGFVIVVPWVIIELFVVTHDSAGDAFV